MSVNPSVTSPLDRTGPDRTTAADQTPALLILLVIYCEVGQPSF